MNNQIKARAITAQRARRFIHYDPVNQPHFTWKAHRGRYWCKGKEAGTITSQGYRQIDIDGVSINASRLAVLIVTGELPPADMHVDHRDHNRSNDAWENLRVCSPFQNSRNRKPNVDNTSGRLGVCWDKTRQRWHAYIGLNHRKINLGYFVVQKDAIAARESAERKYFGEFAGLAGAA